MYSIRNSHLAVPTEKEENRVTLMRTTSDKFISAMQLQKHVKNHKKRSNQQVSRSKIRCSQSRYEVFTLFTGHEGP
jgi:hypothetical protein